jgi:hypothetical protein
MSFPEGLPRQSSSAENFKTSNEVFSSPRATDDFKRHLAANIKGADEAITKYKASPTFASNKDLQAKVQSLEQAQNRLKQIHNIVTQIQNAPQNMALRQQLDREMYQMQVDMCKPIVAEAGTWGEGQDSMRRDPQRSGEYARDANVNFAAAGMVLKSNPNMIHYYCVLFLRAVEAPALKNVLLTAINSVPDAVLKDVMGNVVNRLPREDLRAIAKQIAPGIVAAPQGQAQNIFNPLAMAAPFLQAAAPLAVDSMSDAQLRSIAMTHINSRPPKQVAANVINSVSPDQLKKTMDKVLASMPPQELQHLMIRNFPGSANWLAPDPPIAMSNLAVDASLALRR